MEQQDKSSVHDGLDRKGPGERARREQLARMIRVTHGRSCNLVQNEAKTPPKQLTDLEQREASGMSYPYLSDEDRRLAVMQERGEG